MCLCKAHPATWLHAGLDTRCTRNVAGVTTFKSGNQQFFHCYQHCSLGKWESPCNNARSSSINLLILHHPGTSAISLHQLLWCCSEDRNYFMWCCALVSCLPWHSWQTGCLTQQTTCLQVCCIVCVWMLVKIMLCMIPVCTHVTHLCLSLTRLFCGSIGSWLFVC